MTENIQNPELKEAIERICRISNIDTWKASPYKQFCLMLELPAQSESVYTSGFGYIEENNPISHCHLILDTHENKGLPSEVKYEPTNIFPGENQTQYLTITANNKTHLYNLLDSLESSGLLKNLIQSVFLKADPSALILNSMMGDALEIFKGNGTKTTTEKFTNDLLKNEKTKLPFILSRSLESFETAEEVIDVLINDERDKGDKASGAKKILDYLAERVSVLKPYIQQQREKPGAIVNLIIVGNKTKDKKTPSI